MDFNIKETSDFKNMFTNCSNLDTDEIKIIKELREIAEDETLKPSIPPITISSKYTLPEVQAKIDELSVTLGYKDVDDVSYKPLSLNSDGEVYPEISDGYYAGEAYDAMELLFLLIKEGYIDLDK